MKVLICLKNGTEIKIDEPKVIEYEDGKFKQFDTYEKKDTYYQNPYRNRAILLKVDNDDILYVVYDEDVAKVSKTQA